MQDSTRAADARPRYLQLEINGMHCANCVVAVERALKDAPGVRSVRAGYPPKHRAPDHRARAGVVVVEDFAHRLARGV